MRAVVVCLLVAVVALLAPSVWAEPTQDERERAIELGKRGLELYNEQRWVEAYERFDRANALVHSPVFVLYMARAKRQLGELVRSAALYDSVTREAIPDGAPEPWSDAKKDAVEERAALVERIPRLTIEVMPNGEGAVVVQHGERDLGVLRIFDVDPGPHTVTVRCGEGEPATQTITVAEAERRTLRFEPTCGSTPSRRPAPHPEPVLPPPPMPPYVVEDGSVQTTVGVSLVLLSLVPLSVAAVTAPLTAVWADNLSEACTEDFRCPPEQEDTVDTYDALAHTTTATLIIGVALLTAGAITWGTAPSADDTVFITPRGVGVRF